jgi:hypothetical protein
MISRIRKFFSLCQYIGHRFTLVSFNGIQYRQCSRCGEREIFAIQWFYGSLQQVDGEWRLFPTGLASAHLQLSYPLSQETREKIAEWESVFDNIYARMAAYPPQWRLAYQGDLCVELLPSVDSENSACHT